MEFKQKLNPQTGVFNLIPKNEIINFKAGVPTAANLPLIGNSTNDARITNDTGHLYIWNGATWIDEGDIIDLTWEAISGKPSSTPANIDDAIDKKHASGSDNQTASEISTTESGLSVQDKLDTIVVPPFAQSLITGLVNDLKNLSLNVVLNAFRIAIQGSLSLLHMVDSFVDEYEDESGVDTGASTFEVYDAVNDLYSPVIVPPSEDIDILTGGTATAETYDGGGYEANKGVDDNITTRWTAYGNVSRWWKYDLGAGVTKKVTKLKIITTMGLYKDFTLHGSNNDSDWTLIYTGQQANNDNWQEFTFSNTTAYRYYKLTSSSNWRGDTYIGFYEVEMMESILPGYVEDMTLISNPQTADDTPLTARLVIFEEDVDSITLNTDLKGWVSRDGGSTFSQITLVEESLYDAPARILSGEVDISGQPSGTSMVYKLNSYAKDLKIHGTGLLWN